MNQILSFDKRVCEIVSRIPFGQVATYGQIAELMGSYGSARQVGWSLRRLPISSEVPWHRVVNAKGHISMNPNREGSDWMQREMLIEEGIPVDASCTVPLKEYRWRPVDSNWLIDN